MIEEDEAKGVGGLEVVEHGHHALLGDLELVLGFACTEDRLAMSLHDTHDTRHTTRHARRVLWRTVAEGRAHGAGDVQHNRELHGRPTVFLDALPVELAAHAAPHIVLHPPAVTHVL
jgi:hypothetical protein